MTNVIPTVAIFRKEKMKKSYFGPRPDTLSLLRVVARVYDNSPAGNRQFKSFNFN
jgi:hypothetical protein